MHATNVRDAQAETRRLVCYDCGVACDLGKMREERLVFLRKLGAEEPPPPNHPLSEAPNCIITPHIAWATTAARKRLMETAVDNVRAFLEGRLQNIVN